MFADAEGCVMAICVDEFFCFIRFTALPRFDSFDSISHASNTAPDTAVPMLMSNATRSQPAMSTPPLVERPPAVSLSSSAAARTCVTFGCCSPACPAIAQCSFENSSALDDADAEGVGVPASATDALGQDDAGLIRVSKALTQHHGGDLRPLHDDVVRKVPEDDHLVPVGAIVRNRIGVVDRIAVNVARRSAQP